MFTDIIYLANGNSKQKSAYKSIVDLNVITILKEFKPLIVGTIPIELDIENSDIDIICIAQDLFYFEKLVKKNFGGLESFKQSRKTFQESDSSVNSFLFQNFEFEIFAQNIEPIKQNAYRHMIVESRLIELASNKFKKEIIKLKKNGLKTEAAFAALLKLTGNPYKELLALELLEDSELEKLLGDWK